MEKPIFRIENLRQGMCFKSEGRNYMVTSAEDVYETARGEKLRRIGCIDLSTGELEYIFANAIICPLQVVTVNNSPNIPICNLRVDVELMPDGRFDVYISNEGDSGCHYSGVTADKIGELVASEIECRTEDYK